MKKVAIVTDDSACFAKEEINNLSDLYVVPVPTIIDGKDYYENINLTTDEFYQALEDDKDVRTSQPSPQSVIDLWDNLLKEYETIVYVPLSSGLSSSCDTAKILADDYMDKVYVVDNRRVSVTLKRSIIDALNLKNEGKSAKEIADILTSTASLSTIYIMVDTLKYLKKGGRVTAAGTALGATLHIKPVLSILGGKLDAKAKALGTKKAERIMLDAIKDDIKKIFNNKKDNLEISVAYTYDKDKALEFKNLVEQELNVNVKYVDPLALLIATHIGPGSLAITVSKVVK